MALQQYHVGGTYYGYDPASNQLVAFANMQQLQQYFPSGIQTNAPTLPANISPAAANASPGRVVSLSSSSMGPSSSMPSVPGVAQGNSVQGSSTPPSQSTPPSSTPTTTPVFYKPSPSSATVVDQSGNYVSLAQYKQLTGQSGIPDNQVNWSFVKNGSPAGISQPTSPTSQQSQTPSGNQSSPEQGNPQLAASGQGVLDPNQIDLSRGNQFFFMYPTTHGNTVYLYDKTKQISIPFTSEASFLAYTGETVQQAAAAGQIHNLSGPPAGTIIQDHQGFDDSGQIIDLGSVNTTHPDTTGGDLGTYGKTRNTGVEQDIYNDIGKFFTTMKAAGNINQSTFDQVIANPTNMALYVSAMAYGDYTFDDIWRDAKAKELGIEVKAIDPTMPASQFYQTTDYLNSKYNQQLDPPMNTGMDPNLFNNPIFQIPDAAFQTLVPPLDVNSPEFKAQAEQIKDAYHDVLIQQAEAKTDHEKALADQNYQFLKDSVKRQFGITLSNDAKAAWNQLDQLTESSLAGNTLNSGIFNEIQDKILQDMRTTQDQAREQNMSTTEQQKMQFYTTNATPEQIQNDLTPEERKAWGLTASADTLNYLNNLKTQYPDLTDQQIQSIKDSMMDSNGNSYSNLYGSLASNKYKLQQEKKTYQEMTLENQKLQADTKAYSPYTKSENPYIRSTAANTPAVPTTSTPSTSSTSPSGLQMPSGYAASSSSTPTAPSGLQMPTNPTIPNTTTPISTTPPGGLQMPSNNDLSSQYGLYKGTVYNLKSGMGYSDPSSFFKDSGVSSFNNVKFNTSYTPSFYKYNDSPTVYNGNNNQGISNTDDFYKMGGAKDFSNVTTKSR